MYDWRSLNSCSEYFKLLEYRMPRKLMIKKVLKFWLAEMNLC